jgi:hypothetical protein
MAKLVRSWLDGLVEENRRPQAAPYVTGRARVRPLAPPAVANGSFPAGVVGKVSPPPRASELGEVEHDELTMETPQSLEMGGAKR